MANIAMFLPRQINLEYAQKVIEEDQVEIQILKVIDNSSAVLEAQDAITAGADIIIARGLQAMLIKEHTNIPVVEMPMTVQEVGLMVLKAKKLLKKEYPTIGMIGFRNMFSNMDHLENLFDFKLRLYLLNELDEARDKVKQAILEGADLIIGGVKANQVAFEIGFPSLFIETREGSIRNALDIAKNMSYVFDLEKHNNAQLETLLDTSFNGIIKINAYKEIVAVNRMIEQALQKNAADVIGFPIDKILPGIDIESIDRILEGSDEMYSTSLTIYNNLFMMVGAPIQYDGHFSGAILTVHKIREREKGDQDNRKEGVINGYIARRNFGDIQRKSKKIKKALELVKAYAISQRPVLIYGETGTEKEIFAECIHNNSAQKGGPFLNINCSTLSATEQKSVIFGICEEENIKRVKKSAMEMATYGTVLLQQIECLSLESQYLLYKAIHDKLFWHRESMVKRNFAVRIIATSYQELAVLVEQGKFREDLYFVLSAFKLEIPPLRDCQEDIENLAKMYIQHYETLYSTFVEIKKDAYKVMKEYSWEGNLLQLEYFCERLILTAHRKSVDEGFVHNLLEDIYFTVRKNGEIEQKIILKHPEAIKIAELLEQYQGNRALTAEHLGISTTTLWRKIKKYGIGSKYQV